MKTHRLAIAASLLLSQAALAQSTVYDPATGKTNTQPAPKQPGAADPASKIGPIKPLMQMPVAVNPPFTRLAELGPDGKIIRVDGNLDLLAMPRNTFVDQACRDRVRPIVKAWMADVDQLTIDNLDFLEKIEPPNGGPGVIDNVNINDQATLHAVAQMMTMLMAAGPLSNHLEMKEGFNREQSQRNQEIVSDYLQQVMNEIMKEAGVPNAQGQELNEEQKLAQVNSVSRFLYHISCRDTIDAYHRQLADAAPVMDKAVASLGLSADQSAKLKDLVAACKSAGTVQEKRKASRAVLDALTFDQRRAVLTKALEINGPCDPLATMGPPIPPPPNAGTPAAPAAPAASSNGPAYK